MTHRRNLIKTVMAAGSLALAGIAATAPAAAEELDTINENGVIRIAMSGAYPPFNFVNDQNEVVGFDPSIGIEIAKRMGLETEIVTTAWDGIIGGLLANKYDAIVGSMTITEERDEVVDFVGPYYTTKRAIFTKAGSDITSMSQLGDVQVGVTLGETHEEWAREQGYSVRTYKGLPELLLELDNGRVDVIVNDSIAAILAMTEKGQEFAIIEDLEGAPVVFLDPEKPLGGERAAGAWVWAELWTDDPVAASKFYGEVVGYERSETDLLGQAYPVFEIDGEPRAGMVEIEDKAVDPIWAPYLAVADVAATVRKAKSLGGRILLEPKPENRGGRVALLADPTGGAFFIYQIEADS